MAIELLMPALSPTMKDGTLAKWHKKEGDNVKIGDLIAEIETDKATMEVEAIDEGIIGKIFVNAGSENVKVNEIIAIILEEGEDLSDIDKLISSKSETSNQQTKIQAPLQEVKLNQELNSYAKKDLSDKIFISPLAKRIAEQNKIEVKDIKGSGPKGRIIKSDVEDFILSRNVINDISIDFQESNLNFRNQENFTKVPNNNMRKVIAKRLAESKRDIPHFYLEIECEMDQLLALRKQINFSNDSEKSESKISVNDLIIKAVALSLKKVPEANASWTEEAILKYNNIDISVAVAIEGGLITPIIQNADKKSLGLISEQMKDLAIRARNSSLKPEEFQGGSFTISNLGMFGIGSFKAIINPPQSGILAIGATSEKAVVKNGKLEIASVMKITLSADHRVIDGAIGAKFLSKFKEYIENPVSMLIY